EPGLSYLERWRCVSRLGLFNGGLDSLESSPYGTLSRGAFSAPSLVTPTRGLLPGIVWFPFATVIFSLPTPPHTASGQARRSPLLSFFPEVSHDGTYDQTTPSLLRSPKGQTSQTPAPTPSLGPPQNPGQGQERSRASAGGRPGPSAARTTSARGRHRHRFPLPLGLRRFHHRSRFRLG